MKITVAGAGVGGLAVASALACSGHDVTVAEAAPEIGEIGAGLQVSPNGMAVIRNLGLERALGDVSFRATTVRLIDGPTGRAVLTLDLARHAPDLDWRFVHRARLIDVLIESATANGVSIETNRKVTPPAGHAALPGDALLIGADGLRSAVRQSIDGNSKAAFTGQVAWRALIADSGERVAEVHMGAGRHLVSYPLPGGLRNIVGVEERAEWAAESWSQKDDPAVLREAFRTFAPRVRDWLAKVETVHLWGLFRHPVVTRWHSGAQVILGDAAHPTLPFLAQGANLALEDAAALADCIQRYPLVQALERYQSLRAPRAARVIAAANANARNYHLSFPPLRFAAHTALRIAGAIAPGLALSRFDWLYRHDATNH